MKKSIFAIALVITVASVAFAQKMSDNDKLSLATATSINAQLESKLDVRKAQVGDEVLLKTKKAVKENGRTVIEKGSMLKGRVTEVQERTKGVAASKIGIVFHTLQQGGQNIPINATITSITRGSAYARVGDDTYANTSASSSTSSTTQSSSGGGLLGGVSSTAGSVVNTTTSTVGDAARTTGQVVGATAQTAGRATGIVSSNIPGLQVSQSTNASASGGSTLSLTGGNLKLEKGTTFDLNISQSSSVSTQSNKVDNK
ncbi:MAG: hypothetical protein ACRD6X_04705 [Pyrinomonadaceae bacterium]